MAEKAKWFSQGPLIDYKWQRSHLSLCCSDSESLLSFFISISSYGPWASCIIHPLGICYKCKSSGLTLDLVLRDPCFSKHTKWFLCTLKFGNTVQVPFEAAPDSSLWRFSSPLWLNMCFSGTEIALQESSRQSIVRFSCLQRKQIPVK
jgi:hypothetical protein